MAKKQRRGPTCRKVKVRGRSWYLCCGRKKGDATGTVFCAAAPFVGKNKVDAGQERRFRVKKDGTACRGWTGPCKGRKGLG